MPCAERSLSKPRMLLCLWKAAFFYWLSFRFLIHEGGGCPLKNPCNLENSRQSDLTKGGKREMWQAHLFIWCTAEVHEADNCWPLAGWSTLMLSALEDFNSHYVPSMQTAGPTLLCVCLQAISSFRSDSFWHIKHPLITEERRLCFYLEGCIRWKAKLSLLALGPSQVSCQEIKSLPQEEITTGWMCGSMSQW